MCELFARYACARGAIDNDEVSYGEGRPKAQIADWDPPAYNYDPASFPDADQHRVIWAHLPEREYPEWSQRIPRLRAAVCITVPELSTTDVMAVTELAARDDGLTLSDEARNYLRAPGTLGGIPLNNYGLGLNLVRRAFRNLADRVTREHPEVLRGPAGAVTDHDRRLLTELTAEDLAAALDRMRSTR
jgi:hypothetical protein